MIVIFSGLSSQKAKNFTIIHVPRFVKNVKRMVFGPLRRIFSYWIFVSGHGIDPFCPNDSIRLAACQSWVAWEQELLKDKLD